MSQSMLALIAGEAITLELPSPREEVIRGVEWGCFDQVFTPAFWFSQAWYNKSASVCVRLGENVTEEIVACLLGGHGFPAEVGLAAFHRLKERGLLIDDRCSGERIRQALTEPLFVNGRSVRYRYPNQRARFVEMALRRLAEESAPIHSDLALRNWLTGFEGIGLKTASWITRNLLESDNVAILDVHIVRAGVLANVFEPQMNPAQHYTFLETRLLEFARALQVPLSVLDALIWHHMRLLGSLAAEVLRSRIYPVWSSEPALQLTSA